MTSPRPRRARVPDRDEYGPQTTAREPDQELPWATAQRWLEEARYYWIATTRPDGRSHSVPMWAVWLDDCLSFSTSPKTATARNLAHNPYAVVHPESATEVVIVEGKVERPAVEALPAGLVAAYEAKYGWKMDPADPGMPFYVLGARAAFSWLAEDVRKTATRWKFGPTSEETDSA